MQQGGAERPGNGGDHCKDTEEHRQDHSAGTRLGLGRRLCDAEGIHEEPDDRYERIHKYGF